MGKAFQEAFAHHDQHLETLSGQLMQASQMAAVSLAFDHTSVLF